MTSEYFGSILEQRLSRRSFVVGTGLATALTTLPTLSLAAQTATPVQKAVATAIEPTRADTLTLAAGLRSDLLIRAGDALFKDTAPIDGKTMQSLAWLTPEAGKRQERLFGTNNDALAFFPTDSSGAAGVLCVNHEYVMAELSFADWPKAGPNRAEARQAWIKSRPQAVAWMQAAHGVSVVQLEKAEQGWRTINDGPLTRRITANTPTDIRGPARGHELMRTTADPSGTVALGTFANCAGGKTPWGTYLTAEENIQDYFGSAKSWADSTKDNATVEAHRRWPLRERSAYGWDLIDSRFDVRQEPREPLRHGWIVEIDPQQPTAPPKKRTALGRFCHEGANTTLTRDRRVAAYMGDDAKFEYVYKFVSRDRYNPSDRAANLDLLDHGTLYVARFDASGQGVWLPLVHDENGALNSRNGFSSQAEVVIKCRAAADLLGATPMDRPEDVEPSPITGRVYMALTKNDERQTANKLFNGRNVDFGPNAANPRPQNDFGHIVELIEENSDAASTRFTWNLFLLAGDPRNTQAKFLTDADAIAAGALAREDLYYAGFADRSKVSPIACPDNLGFDPTGRLWVVTDADTGLIGNNGCYVVPTSGPERGYLRQVVSAPVGAEICGCEFTPDGRTLFLAIQHPGEGGSVDAPVSHWPDGNGLPARSAVIAISREDGSPL
jgi:hypothetical protein